LRALAWRRVGSTLIVERDGSRVTHPMPPMVAKRGDMPGEVIRMTV
jgi:hypothetical protein